MDTDIHFSPHHIHVLPLSSSVDSSSPSHDADEVLHPPGLLHRTHTEADRNASVIHGGHPLERFPPSSYLTWLTSLLWSKLPSSIEQYIVATIRGWKQICTAMLARVMAGGDSHTFIFHHDRASPQRPRSYSPSTIEDPGGCLLAEEDTATQKLGLDESDPTVMGSWTDGMQPPPQRRRSVWVVRPSDGPDGVVNVCSRYIAKDNTERIEIVL